MTPMKMALRMTEVQPQLSMLLQQQTSPIPVRCGRASTPVIVLLPWTCYVRWKQALQSTVPSCILDISEYPVSEMVKFFLSYTHRLVPRLQAKEGTIPILVVKAHREFIGAVVSWKDWQRAAIPEDPQEEARNHARLRYEQERYTIVTAARHLSNFAEAQARGTFQPVIVTWHGQPVLQICGLPKSETPWPPDPPLGIEGMEEEASDLRSQAQRALATIAGPFATEMFNSATATVVRLALEQLLADPLHMQQHIPDEDMPDHPWPAGTAVQLSAHGRALYRDQIEMHGGTGSPPEEGTIFYILGHVTHPVALEDFRNPEASDYRKPWAHPLFAPGQDWTRPIYLTTLFQHDSTVEGFCWYWELELAPQQPRLRSEQDIEAFLLLILPAFQKPLLSAFRHHRQYGLTPHAALECALQQCVSAGLLPWPLPFFEERD